MVVYSDQGGSFPPGKCFLQMEPIPEILSWLKGVSQTLLTVSESSSCVHFVFHFLHVTASQGGRITQIVNTCFCLYKNLRCSWSVGWSGKGQAVLRLVSCVSSGVTIIWSPPLRWRFLKTSNRLFFFLALACELFSDRILGVVVGS